MVCLGANVNWTPPHDPNFESESHRMCGPHMGAMMPQVTLGYLLWVIVWVVDPPWGALGARLGVVGEGANANGTPPHDPNFESESHRMCGPHMGAMMPQVTLGIFLWVIVKVLTHLVGAWGMGPT